jgi:modification methylase
MVGKVKPNTILEGDCVDQMRGLPDACVDVVFADPPYNLQLSGDLRRPNNSLVDGVDQAWDKFASFEAYDEFTRAWLGEAKRLMKDTATLWVIGSYHNIYRIGSILQDMGFWILNDVIWRKTNPMPNFRGRRFTNAHETILWCSKGPEHTRYTFNYAALKSLNDDLQMRSDWLLSVCGGAERLREGRRKAHPTQKPAALLHRVILGSSNPGDLVLDPFFGTGTTGVAARELGRTFVGIENDAEYAALARARLEGVEPLAEDALLTTPNKRDLPRVPFGSLVERGWLRPGTVLTDRTRKHRAKVRADGSLHHHDGTIGSIHRIGAKVQDAPSCNGWTFWFYEEDGKPESIDTLRDRLRKEMR